MTVPERRHGSRSPLSQFSSSFNTFISCCLSRSLMGCSRGRSRWLHSSDVQTQGGAYSAEREAENEPTGSRESGDLLPVQSGPLHKLQHNYRFYHIVVSLNTHLSLWTRAVVTLTYLTGSKNACRTSLMQTPRVVCQIYFCT